MTKLESNIFDTALVFEGGSMRAAYTCAVANYFLEKGLYFDKVYGVSAGSSNTVNYLSRDVWRTRESFTGFMNDPRAGDIKTFLQHKGMFNAHFIYQEAGLPDNLAPFDFDTFMANPADFCIVSFNRDTGEDIYYSKADIRELEDIMIRVRASSTLPVFMPAPVVDGTVCYDGGFATGGGLPLKKVLADGYKKMVVIRTRKRGYRKNDNGNWAKLWYCRHPHMRDAVVNRSENYNEACDFLDQLEAEGTAYVFYADDLTLEGTERELALLEANYDAGYAQIQKEWPVLMEFLGNPTLLEPTINKHTAFNR